MSLNGNVRHCRKCIALTRQFTDSATGKDNGGNVATVAERLLNSLNTLRQTKMSMQNQWKLLAQLKEYLNKATDDKNIQYILSKEWINALQKATSEQLEIIKKSSSSSFSSIAKNSSETPVPSEKENSSDKNLPIAAEKKHEIIDATTQENTQPTLKPDIKIPPELKEQNFTLGQAFATAIYKVTSIRKETTTLAIPKWKFNVTSSVPKHSIVSRTRHVLNSITSAESNASRWRRIEDLLTHIDQYPEARHYAIKEGAVAILLRARQNTKDPQIHASIKEALAVLGHVDALPGRGIRILSIDGGGIRGILVIEMLKKLEELTGKKTHEMFDYICGVSTGAILAAVLAAPMEFDTAGHKRKSLDEMSQLYKDLSTRVFTQNTLKGTSSLVWSHSYYDTSLWEQLLQEHLGDKVLIRTSRDPRSPKFSTISAVVNRDRVMAYVFRNYTLPHRVESQYIGSHKHKLWEAVRASAAVPSYFQEFKHGEFLHQDGGILVNNPCAVAMHEAKLLWPNSPVQCVISFGTGRTPHRICEDNDECTDTAISWREKFNRILDSATDTEAVHIMLNDLLPDHVYFRFNPYLTEMLPMVEIRPDKLSQLEQDAKMYIRRNEEKFQKAARALSEERKLQQKIGDWITLQKRMSRL